MKKIFICILAFLLCTTLIFSFTSCKNDKTITVGASPTPHAKILTAIKDELKQQGYTLEIKEYSDYILPNVGVNDGSLDANFFQHLPYLNNYNAENDTDLVSVYSVHYEPFALFGNGITTLENLPKGTEIFIPNDNSNGTRALFLLAQEGLIELPEDASAEKGVKVDDVINPNEYEIIPIEAKLLVTYLRENENCISAINGNYALSGNLDFDTALAYENAGEAALLYANIIAVKKENKENEKILALIEALKSPTVAKYINETFGKTVIPVEASK